MDGYLDAHNDLFVQIPNELGTPLVWYKTTICCFRLTELMAHYQDSGWQVRPLLLVRDVRHVWNSLVRKPYGRNGTSSEDPPLRVRFRRFKEDWQHFRAAGWPILKFESFLAEPERALQDTCRSLGLSWDPSMITWPKTVADIANTRHGNETFRTSRGPCLTDTMREPSANLSHVLPGDLHWLETEFKEYNQINGYPRSLPTSVSPLRLTQRAIPRYSVTRHSQRKARYRPVPWFMRKFNQVKRACTTALSACLSMLVAP
jgi:hypothetical protein